MENNTQGIVACAVGALAASQDALLAIFFGLFWGVGAFITDSFIAMRNGRR